MLGSHEKKGNATLCVASSRDGPTFNLTLLWYGSFGARCNNDINCACVVTIPRKVQSQHVQEVLWQKPCANYHNTWIALDAEENTSSKN